MPIFRRSTCATKTTDNGQLTTDSLSSFEEKPAETLWHVEARLRGERGLPCDVATRGVFADAAEEVCAPACARVRRATERRPRDAHRECDCIFLRARGEGRAGVVLPI